MSLKIEHSGVFLTIKVYVYLTMQIEFIPPNVLNMLIHFSII